MKAVHFGAGNIGRGFIGLILSQSGYDVCFVDVDDRLVRRLNEHHSYTVTLANESKDTYVVRDVAAIHGSDAAFVAKAVASADLVTTAIGANNLKFVAPGIANGIQLRHENAAGPMPIIACENGIGASSNLKRLVYEHLSAAAKDYADSTICFPNAMVDRIVPQQTMDEHAGVVVEPFYEWVVERANNAGAGQICGVHYVDSLQPYLERKLFTVNTGHCSAAYMGYLKRYTTIQQAMNDPLLKQRVLSVLQETGNVLIQQFGFDRQEHSAYIETTMERFSNPLLSDDITRIGRSPIRKLSPDERLVYPAMQAYSIGVQPQFLTLAIAAAFRFDPLDDQEAIALQSVIASDGIGRAITHFTHIPSGHPVHQMIKEQYDRLVAAAT